MAAKAALADRLYKILREPPKFKCCIVGFDGFTDEIISVVDQRHDVSSYDPVNDMVSFGQRIVAAAGKSCNVELVTVKKKMGGNAPLMAMALLESGHHINFIGTIGAPGQIEEIFSTMVERCDKVITLCPSGHTDALEFKDGKVMLGKMGVLQRIGYEKLMEQISEEELREMFDAADLFASANWTMLPWMTDLWQRLLEDIVPHLRPRDRWMFVDLADPRKRSDGDLKKALEVLNRFSACYRVVLGLNFAEAVRVAEVLTAQRSDNTPQSLQMMAASIFQKLSLAQIVIHAIDGAAIATEEGTWYVEGPHFKHPHCSTGGGDNFNAGYCSGLLHDLSQEETLLMAVATSGYYVSHGESPSMDALANFLQDWEEGKLSLLDCF